MRRLAHVLFPFLTLVLAATPALSQGEGAALGDIYLSAVDTEYQDEVEAEPFVNFSFHLVVQIDYADIGLPDQQAANGVKAWECGVTVDPQITVLSRTLRPETSLNLGSDDNWIVGTGQNLRANTTPYGVVAYTGLLLADADSLWVTLAPPDPSSFEPATFGWNEFNSSGECTLPGGGDTPCLRQFAQTIVGPGSFCVNCAVPIDRSSWGALKARYTK